MNAYIAIFNNQVKQILQYRAAALSGALTQFFFGIARIEALIAFYHSGSASQPMSLASAIAYLWISQMCLGLIAFHPDNRIIAMIRDGSLAYEVIRPLRLSLAWFATSLANRLTITIMRAIPLLIAILFLPDPYSFSIHASMMQFIYFIVCICLGILIAAAFNNLYNTVTIYLMSSQGFTKFLMILALFATGNVIPLPLMPEWIKPVMYAMPFAGIIDYPIQILTGTITGQTILYVFMHQIFWIITLMIVTDQMMQHKLKHVMIQGG